LNWLVRQASDNEANFNTIERMIHYIKNIEQENEKIINDIEPNKNWPNFGNISFINYHTKYRNDLPFVLNNLNFNIFSNQSIGFFYLFTI
jgi:ABC-type multidrug transport system fused ATPase/permease subunit